MIKVDHRLALLSEVYYEFRSAVQTPNIDLERVEQIILKDTELTVRLLKIVNSAFYSFSSKVKTISQAISLIGTEQFSYLALSISIIYKFRGIPEDVMNMNSYWRHSIACGLVSKKTGWI
jgi:HD-like signal output (HDOD) protein